MYSDFCLIQIPQLKVGRKLPGCALVRFRNKHTIVVAGGEDSNGHPLKNVEILQFEAPDINEDGIKGALIDSTWPTWQDIPNLKLARSNFPSVGIIKGFLTVTAGNVDSRNPQDQVSVERFDEGSKSWIVRHDTNLKSSRFGHSTLKVSKEWCDCE